MALNDNHSGGTRQYREHGQRSLGIGGPRYADQCGFAESARRGTGEERGGVPREAVARREVYSDDSPEDYIPELRFANMRGTDYEPYEVVFEQAPPNTPQMTGAPLPDVGEPPIRYSHCLMTQGLFERLMKDENFNPTERLDIESMSGPPADPDPMPVASGIEEIVSGAAPLGQAAPQVSLPPCSTADSGQYDHFDQLPA